MWIRGDGDAADGDANGDGDDYDAVFVNGSVDFGPDLVVCCVDCAVGAVGAAAAAAAAAAATAGILQASRLVPCRLRHRCRLFCTKYIF